jgi:hypothetical protein
VEFFVKRIRIVLAGMPRMMLEFMETIIASHPDLYVAGRVPVDGNLLATMRRCRADVLVVLQPDGKSSETSADRMFWRRPSKVLAIIEGGRKGVLYVLRPHATAVGELSVDNLVDAIRSAGQA